MAKILVADDDAGVRDAVAKALTAAGHTVELVEDGAAALERYQRQPPPDLLVVDLYMPGMDGLETIIRLKRLQPEVRILAMSGGGFREKYDVLAMAYKAGASKTIAKPFDLDDFRAAVSALLSPPSEFQPEPPEPPRKATVLLVDDDERTRSILRRRLSVAGYAVVEAADAERGLEQFQARPPDAVVTDLILPGQSGGDFIASVRSQAPEVGIVAISGDLEELDAAHQDARGVPKFTTLPKPFTTEQLLDALDTVMAADRGPAPRTSLLKRLLGWLSRGG